MLYTNLPLLYFYSLSANVPIIKTWWHCCVSLYFLAAVWTLERYINLQVVIASMTLSAQHRRHCGSLGLGYETAALQLTSVCVVWCRAPVVKCDVMETS